MMADLRAVTKVSLENRITQPIPQLVSAIGLPAFGSELLHYLNDTLGAEHFTMFSVPAQCPFGVLAESMDGSDSAQRQFALYTKEAFWRGDPSLALALRDARADGLSMVRLDVSALTDDAFRYQVYDQQQMGERLLVCGQGSGQTLGLSIVRPAYRGLLPADDLTKFGAMSAMLLAIVAKHVMVMAPRPSIALALTSLGLIETIVRTATEPFPKREVQVCARALYGLSSAGIAVDLGVGEETVNTYRKRVYKRLSIGTHRELLLWYVRLWSEFSAGNDPEHADLGPGNRRDPPTLVH